MASQTKNQFRPPIVTLMGHIDHGKTSLLDKIRSANTWVKEAGGITQHISCFSVTVKQGKQTQPITFIDTPGHAAFKAMRQQGSQVTDLVVLVISASQGVQAQTKECLTLIKENNLPFIVALNKIDLKNASVDKVKGQLTQAGYTPEEYGGQISCIPVSAKSGQGIDKLLDTILLNAQVMELTSQPDAPLQAHIIESKFQKGRGPCAVVVVKQGTLALGQKVYTSRSDTFIKALLDPYQKPISQVLPGFSATLVGFSSPPAVGSLITDVPFESSSAPAPAPPTPTDKDQKQLPVIIKADTQGTLQALTNSFSNDVLALSSAIGPVSNSDIFLAQSAGAQILVFNLKTPQFIKNLAKNKKVRIFESKIIYEIIDDINTQVLKMLEPTIDETITGQAKIIDQFKINKDRIAGVSCTQGVLKVGDLVHLKRDQEIIKNTKIANIRQGKLDAAKIKSGNQCGLIFSPYVDFHLDDVIISYYKSKED